jgi:hypothetical protein
MWCPFFFVIQGIVICGTRYARRVAYNRLASFEELEIRVSASVRDYWMT